MFWRGMLLGYFAPVVNLAQALVNALNCVGDLWHSPPPPLAAREQCARDQEICFSDRRSRARAFLANALWLPSFFRFLS
jgi:hypothetical protein